MRRVAWLALALTPHLAAAWESTCRAYPTPSQDVAALLEAKGEACGATGLSTARERWVGAGDEHRQLWEITRARAGLPSSVSATTSLQVFTTSESLTDGAQTVPTLKPAPFEEATRMRFRPFTPGELSQLPDFSYALWDWASGHETCPLAGASTDTDCHDFASHMGPVNANHFVPMSQRFYAHYHQLALARASECAALKTQLGSAGARFVSFLEACELEALSYEAVGQHFLQDAWSMGHMWQRWGGARLEDFPGATSEEQRDRAVLVALVSGLFHGARSVLQAVPAWTGYDVNDALCAPWDDVRFVSSAGEQARGIGDNYLSLLPPQGAYEAFDLQSRSFFECAVSGVLEVYLAAGEIHGLATPEMGLRSVDPTGPGCFGQRATNAAMARAAGVDIKLGLLQTTIPVDARFVSLLVPEVARQQGKVPAAPKLRHQLRLELARFVTMTRLRAKEAPDATDVADGQWGTLLGAAPNGQYPTLPSYLDPSWPWSAGDEHAEQVRRVFHRAHAAELCASFDSARLDALKAHAADPTLDVEARAVACTVCAEIAVRHLRVGASSASYDTSQEPLCSYVLPGAALLYAESPGSTDPTAVASHWCCP